jgi:hypothetical protein
MTEHQASRAEHQPGGGMAALERDVIACPPDQQALGLVEGILDEACISDELSKDTLQTRLAMIGGYGRRLKVLLERRDEEREGRDKATEIALLVLDKAIGGLKGVQDGMATPLPSIAALIIEAEAALARVKGEA